MPATVETPAQHERDLRSANKEWKRGKDSTTKWSYGSRPLSGCRYDYISGAVVGGDEVQRSQSRPSKRPGDRWRHKSGMAPGRARVVTSTCEALEDARRFPSADPAYGGLSWHMSAAAPDNFLYSFDQTDSPGRPLTLDTFVKPPHPRETERLVEKEYEILDTNGQPLKGRKAKQNLRRGPSNKSDADVDGLDDEDGFELV